MTAAQQVTLASAAARVALDQRNEAMRQMRDEGATLRQIAAPAGLTHAGVKKILDRPSSSDDKC